METNKQAVNIFEYDAFQIEDYQEVVNKFNEYSYNDEDILKYIDESDPDHAYNLEKISAAPLIFCAWVCNVFKYYKNANNVAVELFLSGSAVRLDGFNKYVDDLKTNNSFTAKNLALTMVDYVATKGGEWGISGLFKKIALSSLKGAIAIGGAEAIVGWIAGEVIAGSYNIYVGPNVKMEINERDKTYTFVVDGKLSNFLKPRGGFGQVVDGTVDKLRDIVNSILSDKFKLDDATVANVWVNLDLAYANKWHLESLDKEKESLIIDYEQNTGFTFSTQVDKDTRILYSGNLHDIYESSAEHKRTLALICQGHGRDFKATTSTGTENVINYVARPPQQFMDKISSGSKRELYALKHLYPFVLESTDAAYNEINPEDFSKEYINDRYAFWVEKLNAEKNGSSESSDGNYYLDKSTGFELPVMQIQTIDANSVTIPNDNAPRCIFLGDDSEDARQYDGRSFSAVQHVYGSAGDDTIRSGSGNDRLDGDKGSNRLEGGKGLDAYVVRDDGAPDTIEDEDGQGALYCGEARIKGCFVNDKDAPNYYFSPDKVWRFHGRTDGGTITLSRLQDGTTDSYRAVAKIENWKNGDLNIYLVNRNELIDADMSQKSVNVGLNLRLAERGAQVKGGTKNDNITGGPFNDVIETGEGAVSIVNANAGSDIVKGGPGNDWYPLTG